MLNRDALLDALNKTFRNLAADLPEEAQEILDVAETAVRECVYDLDEEPKSGEWIYNANGKPRCSECGIEIDPNDIAPYCSNCGAHMEGESVDE